MEKNVFLNYTHGTTLQNLCKDILQSGTENKKAYIKWILTERETLRKKQPSVWEIPVSMKQYDDYLEKIDNALYSEHMAEEIEMLHSEIVQKTRRKIHALFLTQETFCWPSMESVFQAAQESEDYEAALVYTPYFHKNFSEQVDYYEAYREMGLPVLRHNEYDLPRVSPDVLFIIKPYDNIPEQYVVTNIERVVPRIVYIAYGLELTMDLIKFGFQYYGHYKAWRHCAYGEIVKEYGTKYGYRNGENIVVWGHPKADYYLNPDKNKDTIPQEWKERIGSRKTILWTPHHLISLEENGTGTWLVWGEHILNTALAHSELFFIVRPHPLLLGALVNSGSMTQEQVNQIREKIDSAENMLWDTNDDYHVAFDAADAILTDGTTFSLEFLYTKKPIILTPRNMEGFYMYEDMLESYYIVNKLQDIPDFMQMIGRGEDPLREKRVAMYDKTFFIPETGTIGENIVRQVRIDLEKECSAVDVPAASKEEKLVQTESFEGDVEFPLVSILVLCYKNQDLLYGMLDTIFRQDYPRIQLVISDDASVDFDVERIQRYINLFKRSNIVDVVVRTNEVNMRTVPHIHMAVNYVKGDYLVFTAADDRFTDNDVISTYVKEFLRNPDKQWLVARCRVTSLDYKKTHHYLPAASDEPYFMEGDARRIFSRWSRRGLAIPCCMAFRTKAIEMVGGFDLDYLFIEDWPLELKLLRGGNAPIFCNKITALHSTGGITNSNDRYGKEIRRLFYEDKYMVFRKEVDPYLHMLTLEDRKAYKQYLVEIMERHYLFYIDLPGASLMEKIKLGLKKPIRFWWMFENAFMKLEVPRKKMMVISFAALLASMLFLRADIAPVPDMAFHATGWCCMAGGLCLAAAAVGSFILHKLFERKAEQRRRLVN